MMEKAVNSTRVMSSMDFDPEDIAELGIGDEKAYYP